MDAIPLPAADATRALIERGRCPPALFRESLLAIPPPARDAWLDRVLALDSLPDDSPNLPPGSVGYLPSAVDALLRMVDHAPVTASDVFVDVGSGVGRAAALVHLLTGAKSVGVEIQRPLVAASRALADRLHLPGLSFLEGDAAELAPTVTDASVFFLYCPFGGELLERLMTNLEPLARQRTLSVGCLDLPLPRSDWLEFAEPRWLDLEIHRSRTPSPPRRF